MELGIPKIHRILNAIIYWNGKAGSLYCWTLKKILITSKNSSNESCPKLNFLQKAQWKHIFIYPGVELWSFKDVPCLKYYNTLKWESRFTLGPNAAKNIDYIEKWFKWKLRKIKHPTENLVEAYLYLGDSPKNVDFQGGKNYFLKVIFSFVFLEIDCWGVPEAKIAVQHDSYSK